MAIDLSKLQILKQQIQTAKDLKQPMHYFFDHFADFPEFIKMGDETKDELLDRIILAIGQQFFKKKNVKIQRKVYHLLEEHHFIHGPVLIENKMMSFAYFTDIRQGVFSLHVAPKVFYGRMNAIEILTPPKDIRLN